MARKLILAALLAVPIAASDANAATVLVTGNWSFTANGQGFSNQSFIGLASFTYDDSAITGGRGDEQLVDIPLLSFSQTPDTIGSTTFDTSNMLGSVSFRSGTPISYRVYSDAFAGGNDPRGVGDYMAIEFHPISAAAEATISHGGFPNEAIGRTNTKGDPLTDVNITFSAVPEPSSYALFGLGLFGMAFAARRRRANA